MRVRRGEEGKRGRGAKCLNGQKAVPWGNCFGNFLLFLLFSFSPFLLFAVHGTESQSDEARIRQLIEHYFEVWSVQDMKAYAECFVPDAVVAYVDPRGHLTTLSRDRFVETQVQAHQQSRVPMREVAEEISIKQDNDMAVALVRWRLMKKSEAIRGVDAFTLIKTREGWRIIYLAFKTDG